jgi:uncharacterized membrane protein
MLHTAEAFIDVAVPVTVAYAQWTQLEEFPRFMGGVEHVRQIDEHRAHWEVQVGGHHEQWDAEITKQIPNKRIAWRSFTGVKNAGVVTFHRLANDETRIMVQITYDPKGILENLGSFLGVVPARVKQELKCFKAFIENRGEPTGAWRGTVPAPGERPHVA